MMLRDKNVVITGKIPGHSRETAAQAVREVGGIVQSGITGATDVLITGAKVGPAKMKKAEELGVTIVPWNQVKPDGRIEADLENGPHHSEVPEPAAQDRVIGSMLAQGGELPVGPEWLYEVKWDGYRCHAVIRGGRVAMQSRGGRTEYGPQFPEIAKQLAELPDCSLDGELVVLDENGHSSFDRMGQKGQASYVVFDLLELDGVDMRSLPLEARRQALATMLTEAHEATRATRVALSPAFSDGAKLLQEAHEQGLEGLVAKKRDSTYREGLRSTDWIKVKIRLEQEFAVVGWELGTNRLSQTMGSLVLAVNDESGTLIHCGSVGTGFTDAQRPEIRELLVEVEEPPIDVSGWAPAARRSVRWVRPELVVQVAFQRWTADGMLWHPAFLGIRSDKLVDDVRREPVNGDG